MQKDNGAMRNQKGINAWRGLRKKLRDKSF